MKESFIVSAVEPAVLSKDVGKLSTIDCRLQPSPRSGFKHRVALSDAEQSLLFGRILGRIWAPQNTKDCSSVRYWVVNAAGANWSQSAH